MPKRRWHVGQKVWVVTRERIRVGCLLEMVRDLAKVEFRNGRCHWYPKKWLEDDGTEAHDRWFNCRDYQGPVGDDKLRVGALW